MKKKKNPIEASTNKEASSFNIKKALVALSGGADSVAATFALKKAGIEILALHCNFHLRGEESNRDMEFVKNFCRIINIPLDIMDFDVQKYMRQNKGSSLEMACRNLRHEWFAMRLKETNFDRIVTGHNADDNIETFFLNMLRGSGTRGLKGMEVDNGFIWRPLLGFHRLEIIKYLEENNLSFVVDSTNLESDYRRNFLRNKIFPLLRNEWKGFDTALDKTIDHLKGENKIVEKLLNDSFTFTQPLSIEAILNFPSPTLLLKRYLDPLGPYVSTPQEIIDAIKANKPHIRKWRLKKGIVFLRNGYLFIEMGHSEGSA